MSKSLPSADRPRAVIAIVPKELVAPIAAAMAMRHQVLYSPTVAEAIARARKNRDVQAFVMSPRSVTNAPHHAVRSLQAAFPGVMTIALVSERGQTAGQQLLGLGHCGIRYLVDVNEADGWRRLRRVVCEARQAHTDGILAATLRVLEPCNADIRHFFDVMIRGAPRVWTCSILAGILGVRPSTFVSRFERAGVPSPKSYLTIVRLVYAAGLFDDGAATVGYVAYKLGYASPQSLGRHLRSTLGMTPTEFRSRVPFNVMLGRYIESHVAQYSDVLRKLRPMLGNG